ncbi:hypothetical protein ACJX0J_028059, partial [Zea mays]
DSEYHGVHLQSYYTQTLLSFYLHHWNIQEKIWCHNTKKALYHSFIYSTLEDEDKFSFSELILLENANMLIDKNSKGVIPTTKLPLHYTEYISLQIYFPIISLIDVANLVNYCRSLI